jgi:nucleotide-binding universal stress UspA family protein
MAQKILVTTDLSANSKAGVRFAIQLAAQNGSSLIFCHVSQLLKPTRWTESRYQHYVDDQLAPVREKLEKFVAAEYERAGSRPGKYKCVAIAGVSVDRSIVAYAEEIKANFICMSTRGAGAITKFLGTNASVILTTSPVPVLIIPKNYKAKPIKKIFYSSDFNDLGYELKKVSDFTAPLKGRILVYHYDYLLNVKETVRKLKKVSAPYKRRNVTFTFEKQNIEEPLVDHLRRDVKKSKASMAVLFTKQNRGWYERIFFSSKTAELSFATTVPLLVFRKR